MSGLPAYHPEWIIRLWFSTPGLQQLNPHYTLFILTLLTIMVVYLKKKRVKVAKPDEEEEAFKHLLMKKKVIEDQIEELTRSYEGNRISSQQYTQKRNEFQRLLDRTVHDLQQFTI